MILACVALLAWGLQYGLTTVWMEFPAGKAGEVALTILWTGLMITVLSTTILLLGRLFEAKRNFA